ncbi:MAG: bifunctional pyr operon transcriptional regulator/uracil phosphoribosyltransferase PyrR [Chromatiales bacterium]
MQQAAILDLIDGMAAKLKTQLARRKRQQPVMIGIHTGGVWVAQRLHKLLDIEEPLGTLNISFYRDDFTRIGLNPKVKPSDIPFEVEGRHIILIDDVLQTGRTIRAAMNEISDFGRPASILLAALIDREGRELPIEASVVGIKPTLREQDYVRLTGPEPLGLEISQADSQRKNGDN